MEGDQLVRFVDRTKGVSGLALAWAPGILNGSRLDYSLTPNIYVDASNYGCSVDLHFLFM
jgi:hypothetical protein